MSVFQVAESVINQCLLCEEGVVLVLLQGLQGSGKTYLSEQLSKRFGSLLVCLSLDDFYLPNRELEELAKTRGPLYEGRGLPGTHDLDLLRRTLSLLFARKEVTIPVYDKSLNAGKGDRLDPKYWRVISDPKAHKIILLEGWCLAFQPKPFAENIPQFLRNQTEALNKVIFMDSQAFLIIRLKYVGTEIPQNQILVKWRWQQETSRKQGLTEDQIRHFLVRFQTFLDAFEPLTNIKECTTIKIDENRTVVK